VKLEGGEEDEEQEPVTDDARNNASPSLVHWTLLPPRQETFFLVFYLVSTYRSFEMGACTKDHDSAWRDDEFLACMWISSPARSFISDRKHAKFGDANRFTLLQGRFGGSGIPAS
jgi:hypothetical protein